MKILVIHPQDKSTDFLVPTYMNLKSFPDFEDVEVEDENGNLINEKRETGTSTKALKTSIIYMKAVKALQEAMERIETLEAKVAALEAK